MKKQILKGFTLIELMIVVAIIGILAAVAVPRFAEVINHAREASTKGNLGAIRSAVSIYYSVEEFSAPNLLAVLSPGFIANVPSGEVPFVDTNGDNTSDASYSWPRNSLTIIADFSTRGTQNLSTDGWAYDPGDLEVWVELSSTSMDSKKYPIYLW